MLLKVSKNGRNTCVSYVNLSANSLKLPRIVDCRTWSSVDSLHGDSSTVSFKESS